MCTVDECQNDVAWKGLCNAHYLRLQRYGSPTGKPAPRVTPQRAFFEEAMSLDVDHCIIWPYAKSKGYGCLSIEGERFYVHALALTRAVGPAPSGMVARHGECNQPSCFNPRHLSWGTRIENQHDRVRDGTDLRGVRHPAARLTEEAVLLIRRSLESRSVLAERYGVSRDTIRAIKVRQTWKHLP